MPRKNAKESTTTSTKDTKESTTTTTKSTTTASKKKTSSKRSSSGTKTASSATSTPPPKRSSKNTKNKNAATTAAATTNESSTSTVIGIAQKSAHVAVPQPLPTTTTTTTTNTSNASLVAQQQQQQHHISSHLHHHHHQQYQQQQSHQHHVHSHHYQQQQQQQQHYYANNSHMNNNNNMMMNVNMSREALKSSVYHDEISRMMYTFGDVRSPLNDSVILVEQYVRCFLIDVIDRAKDLVLQQEEEQELRVETTETTTPTNINTNNDHVITTDEYVGEEKSSGNESEEKKQYKNTEAEDDDDDEDEDDEGEIKFENDGLNDHEYSADSDNDDDDDAAMNGSDRNEEKQKKKKKGMRKLNSKQQHQDQNQGKNANAPLSKTSKSITSVTIGLEHLLFLFRNNDHRLSQISRTLRFKALRKMKSSSSDDTTDVTAVAAASVSGNDSTASSSSRKRKHKNDSGSGGDDDTSQLNVRLNRAMKRLRYDVVSALIEGLSDSEEDNDEEVPLSNDNKDSNNISSNEDVKNETESTTGESKSLEPESVGQNVSPSDQQQEISKEDGNNTHHKTSEGKLEDQTKKTSLHNNVIILDVLQIQKEKEIKMAREQYAAADSVTKNMSVEEYLEYSKCREASFTYHNLKKFSEWIGLSSKKKSSRSKKQDNEKKDDHVEIKMDDSLLEVLGHIAWEAVGLLTQTALIVKRDCNMLQHSRSMTTKALDLFLSEYVIEKNIGLATGVMNPQLRSKLTFFPNDVIKLLDDHKKKHLIHIQHVPHQLRQPIEAHHVLEAVRRLRSMKVSPIDFTYSSRSAQFTF